MKKYTVQKGDTLEVILKEHRIDKTVDEVAALFKNESLFCIREPNLLREGDKLWLPERGAIDPKKVACQNGARHRFMLSSSKRRFVVTVIDWRGKRLPNRDVLLVGDHWERQARTDGNGALKCEIPASARDAWLQVNGDRYPIRIGGLDPLHTITGIQARLANLGDRLGLCDGKVGEKTAASIRRFQADHDLVVDGIVGPKTSKKLLEAYGF